MSQHAPARRLISLPRLSHLLIACVMLASAYLVGTLLRPRIDPARAQTACEHFIIMSYYQGMTPAPQFDQPAHTLLDSHRYQIAGNVLTPDPTGSIAQEPYTCIVRWESGTTYKVENLKLKKIRDTPSPPPAKP